MSSRSHRLKSLMALCALAGVLALSSAIPTAGAAAEPPLAASSNVHVLDHIPGTAAGMNFKDHYAFVSGWGGITVLDIAKADAPQVVGALPLPHFENEDVDLCGPDIADRQRDPAARLDRQRPRVGSHRQLREERLHAGVGRRR
jgi:hypothetical protein